MDLPALMLSRWLLRRRYKSIDDAVRLVFSLVFSLVFILVFFSISRASTSSMASPLYLGFMSICARSSSTSALTLFSETMAAIGPISLNSESPIPSATTLFAAACIVSAASSLSSSTHSLAASFSRAEMLLMVSFCCALKTWVAHAF